MIKKVVKGLLPRGLLARLLLIFLVPLIIIQCSVIFFFYDRHWEKIINRFSNIAGNNITNEAVIRGELTLDEGDPFTKVALDKSIANIKSRNIFKNVK